MFDPARFLAPNEPPHRYAYFPFAVGRHQCLGMHLAMMEGMFIVAQLSKRFLVRPIAGQNVRPLAGITLRQSPFMRARIEPRTHRIEITRGPSGGDLSDLIRTLPQLVRDRAHSDGDRVAYIFLPDETAPRSN